MFAITRIENGIFPFLQTHTSKALSRRWHIDTCHNIVSTVPTRYRKKHPVAPNPHRATFITMRYTKSKMINIHDHLIAYIEVFETTRIPHVITSLTEKRMTDIMTFHEVVTGYGFIFVPLHVSQWIFFLVLHKASKNLL